MDGKSSLEEIARRLTSEFPARFVSWQQALNFAAAVFHGEQPVVGRLFPATPGRAGKFEHDSGSASFRFFLRQ